MGEAVVSIGVRLGNPSFYLRYTDSSYKLEMDLPTPLPPPLHSPKGYLVNEGRCFICVHKLFSRAKLLFVLLFDVIRNVFRSEGILCVKIFHHCYRILGYFA